MGSARIDRMTVDIHGAGEAKRHVCHRARGSCGRCRSKGLISIADIVDIVVVVGKRGERVGM